MSIVSDRLKKAMQDKNITARELSKKSGVSEQDISHYRKGDWMPKRDKCYKLAVALDVSPIWLWALDYEDQSIDEIYNQLTPDNKAQAKQYMLFLLTQQPQEALDV